MREVIVTTLQHAEPAQNSTLGLAQRLHRIENTVEWIQSSLLEAAENGETRQIELVERLEALKDEVGRNHKILKELRSRGCFNSRYVFFVLSVAALCLWLIGVRAYLT